MRAFSQGLQGPPLTPGAAIDALLTRGYRRLRWRYLGLFAAVELLGALAICALAVLFLGLYEAMTLGEAWQIIGVGVAMTGLAFMWRTQRIRPHMRALVRWTREPADRVRAEEAWRCAHDLPAQVRRADVEGLLFAALPTTVFAAALLGLPGRAIPFLLLLVGVVIGQALLVHLFAVELALRPLLRDLRDRLGPVALPHAHGVSLRRRLLGTLPLANIVTGLMVAGLAQPGPGGLEALRADVALVVAVAVIVSVVIGFVAATAIVTPLDELALAAERVHAGDLSVQVVPTATGELGRLAANFDEMVRGLETRQALHLALERYVDPAVAARIVTEGLSLPPREVDATVMFVDLRGFTTFAETADAEAVLGRVNQLLAATIPAVVGNGGHVNKFMGDGVLAVFGVPEPVEDHADRAVRAAAEIAAAADGLKLGIGISSGRVVAGTVGAAGRCEFAVMGDTVNVAARAQEATKTIGADVLLTDSTRRRLAAAADHIVPVGRLELRGRRRPVVLHELTAAPAERPEAA
jgi:adenylate cyclase